MSDLNQIITLGIGVPSDIAHFVLVGLSINDVALVSASPDWIVQAMADDVTIQVSRDDGSLQA